MLDSLWIKNFRSLEHLEVPKLGRVNLIVGKNNCGKSTVLEALRLYAGNAQRALLESIAREHDERYQFRDTDISLPFQDFFTGRSFPADKEAGAIEIGSCDAPRERLRLVHQQIPSPATDKFGELLNRMPLTELDLLVRPYEKYHVISVRKGDQDLSRIPLISNELLRSWGLQHDIAAPCSFIPTQFISMDELADEWDRIVFTEQEAIVKTAMLVMEPNFENLTFVRANEHPTPGSISMRSRTAMVKLRGSDRPIPLSSMGDGMLRVLQLALKLCAAKGGFLLIDEFENGLHYSVQEKVWGLLFEVAQQHNIQIFATTHSWDCIESFTQVALARTATDGVLFRLGRSVRTSDQGRVIATVFDEAALQNITQKDVEVR